MHTKDECKMDPRNITLDLSGGKPKTRMNGQKEGMEAMIKTIRKKIGRTESCAVNRKSYKNSV